MATYNVLEFGAIGDDTANDAPAFQKAIDRCTHDGGGVVLVPAGRVYQCGTFYLKNNVHLYLEPGAVIKPSIHREDFTMPRCPMVCALGAENIAIIGGGEINGRGPHYLAEKLPHIYKKKPGGWRPAPVILYDCKNVTIRDISIRQSAQWTLTLEGCEDAVISGIRIVNDDLIPNDDGIDICNCRNVRISDCYVKAGDDAIVIKAMPNQRGGETKSCENITVTGCILESLSFALNIGCEAKAPMRNMLFDNLTIQNSHRGVGIHLSHGCDVENIIFSNMIVETRIYHPAWWGRGEPIYLVAIPWTHEDAIGVVRNVRFSNILCRSENSALIYGWDKTRIQELVLENVRIEIDKWSEYAGGELDLRPYPGELCTENIMIKHATAGIILKNATDVTLRNCQVVWGNNKQDYFNHAIHSTNVEGLRIENFRGQSAWPEKYEAVVIT
ncbi:MAG: glycosyl hydrolase family 28 protein [Verrucomicrobiota bacterium]|nr:glycosyl hydrolase family 28 protein [Verrucomicrobiota bacterium]